jgi:hypothetical protein
MAKTFLPVSGFRMKEYDPEICIGARKNLLYCLELVLFGVVLVSEVLVIFQLPSITIYLCSFTCTYKIDEEHPPSMLLC